MSTSKEGSNSIKHRLRHCLAFVISCLNAFQRGGQGWIGTAAQPGWRNGLYAQGDDASVLRDLFGPGYSAEVGASQETEHLREGVSSGQIRAVLLSWGPKRVILTGHM